MGEIIRITLQGPDAEPGRILAADVVQLVQGYERALGRAAEARLRRRARTGRRGGAVETATRLLFRGIQRGSLVLELELPEVASDEELELDDSRLGELAAGDVLAILNDPTGTAVDDWTAEALADLGDKLGIGGQQYSGLTVELPARAEGGMSLWRAELGTETRRLLRSRGAASAARGARDDRVVGTLVEVDFESRTAHLRTSDQARVTVTFTEDQADEIQAWLRQPSELEGRVEYDERVGAILSVTLERIVRPATLLGLIDREDFWRHRTVDELVRDQHVAAVDDVDSLADHDATDEQLAAFLDALSS